MRAFSEHPRERDTRPDGCERDAPVPTGTASADAARQLLAALRTVAARRRSGAPLDIAIEALEARAHDPFSGSLDPNAGMQPPQGAAPADLDDKGGAALDDAGPPPLRTVGPGLLGRPEMRPRDRPPETWILAEWGPQMPREPDPERAKAAEEEAREVPEADAKPRPAAVLELLRRARERERGGDRARAEEGGPPPAGFGRPRPAERDPTREREQRDEMADAARLADKAAAGEKALLRGPTPKDEEKEGGGKPGAKPAPGAPGAATPLPSAKEKPRGAEPARGGGGVGGAELVEAWQDRVVADATAVTVAPAPDADRYVVLHQKATQKAVEQTPQQKMDLLNSAENAVTPLEKFDDSELQLPQPDPLPKARMAVQQKTGRSLPKQQLPDLETSPLGNVPEIGTLVYADKEGNKHVLREIAPGKYSEIQVVAPGQKPPKGMDFVKQEVRKEAKLDGKGTLVERIRAHNDKEPRNLEVKRRRGAAITTDMPMKGPVVPKIQGLPKVDTTKVIARILDGAPGHASKITQDARAAYPGGRALDAGYVSQFVPDVKGDIVKEMRRIARACGEAGKVLDERLEKEGTKYQAEIDDTQKQIEEANKEAKKGRKTVSEELSDHIYGLVDDIDRRIQDQEAVTKGGYEPEEVKAERKRLLDSNEDVVETWLGRYELLRKNRGEQLGKARDAQLRAYEATAELDRRQLEAHADPADKRTSEAQKELDDAKKQIDDWEKDRKLDVRKAVDKLISESNGLAGDYKQELKDAGTDYEKKIKEWADKRLGYEKSWWRKLIEAIAEWLGLAREEKRVWEERSVEDNKANLDRDEIFLDKLIILHKDGLTEAQIEAMEGLTAEQKVIAKTYFTGATKGDTVAALAAGLVARLGSQWRPVLQQRIEQKVLHDHYSIVIAVAEASGCDVRARVHKLDGAFSGPGTNKNDVYAALTGLTPVQARAVELSYEFVWPKRSLRWDLEGELYDLGEQLWGSHHDADQAYALLQGNKEAQYENIAVQLDYAMKGVGLGTGIGTDKSGIFKLLRGKTPEEIAGIRRAYKAKYGRDLDATVLDELEIGSAPGYDQAQFAALMKADLETADAIQARRAHGLVGETGAGAALVNLFVRDYKEAETVYEDVRADVEADAAAAARRGEPWDTAEFDRQLKRRLEKLDARFGELFASDFAGLKPGESALLAAHKTAFSKDQRQLLTGMRTQRFDLESAARISIEHKALILPDKKEINKTLEAQYLRSFSEKRRDLEAAERKKQKEEWDACTVRKKDGTVDDKATEEKRKEWRKTWLDRDRQAKRARELDREAETQAREETKVKMAALKVAYEKDFTYGFWTHGSFEADVYAATNVTWPWEKRTEDTDKTMALLAGKGYLTPAQQLLFGVKGAGTDESGVHRGYAGRSKEEIEEIHRELRQRLDKIGVDKDVKAADWVLDDFSGRELDDVTIAMMGDPITPQEKLAVERKRVELEIKALKGNSTTDAIIGGLLGGPIGAVVAPSAFGGLREWMTRDERLYMEGRLKELEADITRLDEIKADLNKRGIHEGDEAWYKELGEQYDKIDRQAEAVRGAVAAHRASVDAIANWATVIIQVVVAAVALVVGWILTPVTGGASAALGTMIWIAVLSSIATTGLTMAAKAILKGGAYGWEEASTDAALGVVEALAAAFTAGYGGQILKGLGLAAAEADGLIKALVKGGMGHFLMGAVGAAPGALVGAALSDDGSLMGALHHMIVGSALSVGMAGLTHPINQRVMAFKQGRLQASMVNDLIITRANVGERADMLKVFQQQKPGATMRDLLAELDNAILRNRPRAFEEPTLQNGMRKELLDGLPPPARKPLEGARIEVVSDRDFAQLTGNAPEPAGVILRDGKPVVVVRPGTDLALVAREAPHLFAVPSDVTAPRAAPKPPPVEAAKPRPRGASASPDPLAAPEARPQTPEPPRKTLPEPPPGRTIVEPYAGPKMDSPIDLAARNPEARVVATEARIKPDPLEVKRLTDAGGTFIPDNRPGALPVASVDEIKMRFPLPHDRAIKQDFVRRLGELEAMFPNRPRHELLNQAMHDVTHAAESLTAYAPYALERLKPGGTLEVVFWERQIVGELADAGRLRFIDPATGKAYALELVGMQMMPRGQVAPHSGFGIPGITHATEVHVARFRKVELETKLPAGAQGPDVVGRVVGTHSGRPYFPETAGGPVRDLDYSRIKFTARAVDVVEAHVRRFDGGGEMELAMLDRLRRIVAGEIPPTDFDRAFYSHELRESVRYRRLGYRTGQPLDDEAAYRMWNDAHTATLEDYRLREKLPGGGRALFHPEVVERFEPKITGAQGPELPEPLVRPARPLLAPGESLPPRVRRNFEIDLRAAGHPPDQVRALSDHELLARYAELQVAERPRRIAEYRATLGQAAQGELDALQAATHLHHEPIAGTVQHRVGVALETPVRVNPRLQPGDVHVSYVGGKLELHVGPGATLRDVLGHIPTLATYKRYEGVSGLVRRVTDATRRLLRGGARLPYGSRAREAWDELQKLPGLIEDRRVQLAGRALDLTTRARLEAEIDGFERQLAGHVKDLGDVRPGRGYVAAKVVPMDPADIDAEIDALKARGILKEAEISTYRRLRQAVGEDIPGVRSLTALETGNRVDFIFHEDDNFLALLEKKGSKNWTTTKGNAPSKQLGETLIALQKSTFDGLALPDYLLANQWSGGRRYKLLLVSTSVNPGDEALLAVVISEGRITAYYPAKGEHIEAFVRQHAPEEYDQLLRRTAGDPAARQPEMEALYEQLRTTRPHDIGGVHAPELGPNDRIILLPVEGAVPNQEALRQAGAFHGD